MAKSTIESGKELTHNILEEGIELIKPNAKTLDSTEDCFLSHTLAKLISGICAFLAFMISTKLIIKHLRYYTKPDEQRWILRLIFIVPIYSFISFVSLLLFGNSSGDIFIYLDSIRSCYEAFVIYSFLSLCFNGYLGGEGKIVNALNGRPLPSSYRTLTCCLKNKAFSIQTLRFCKQATLQFCVVKILVTVLTLILESLDLYHQGNFNPKYGFVYLIIIQNISISTALWSLALFYLTTKEILSPYYPLLKFITVKSVIFLSFWQGAVISLLEVLGYISDIKEIPKGVVATGWQNFLTSIEMFLAAVAFWVAFSYKPYVPVRFEADSISHSNIEKGRQGQIDGNNNNISELGGNERNQGISGAYGTLGNPNGGTFGNGYQDGLGQIISGPTGLGAPESQAASANHTASTNSGAGSSVNGKQASNSRNGHMGTSNTRSKYLSKVPKFDALTNTLKDSLDPRDIFQDAVHNFSNRYSPYYNASQNDDDEMLVDNEEGRSQEGSSRGNARDETHIN